MVWISEGWMLRKTEVYSSHVWRKLSESWVGDAIMTTDYVTKTILSNLRIKKIEKQIKKIRWAQSDSLFPG